MNSGKPVAVYKLRRSRLVGRFTFEAGRDRYVEILAEDSEGQALVDAVRFLKVYGEK